MIHLDLPQNARDSVVDEEEQQERARFGPRSTGNQLDLERKAGENG
jgi:hypothetical protein